MTLCDAMCVLLAVELPAASGTITSLAIFLIVLQNTSMSGTDLEKLLGMLFLL